MLPCVVWVNCTALRIICAVTTVRILSLIYPPYSKCWPFYDSHTWTDILERKSVGLSMSCFGTGGDEALKEQTRRNKVIDQQLKKDKDVYGNTHRLLLLGELYEMMVHVWGVSWLLCYTDLGYSPSFSDQIPSRNVGIAPCSNSPALEFWFKI